MKPYYLFLVLFLPIVSASVFIPEGTVITTINATWNFTNNVTLDNMTTGQTSVMFENDNISILPNSPVNISINSWTSTSSHSFSITGTADIPYNVTISGLDGVILYNGSYDKTPWTTATPLLNWYYRFDRQYDITFLDEATHVKVDFENVTISFVSDSYSVNSTTEDGNLTISLPSEEYLVRYYGETYQERFYHLDVTSYTTGNLILYMIADNNNTNISVTVLDQFSLPVEGAHVKALKYDINTNSYLLQEIGITNAEGITELHLTLNDEYYKFIVEYSDEVVLTTNPSYIYDDTITLHVSIGDTLGEDFYHFRDISFTLTYNDATDNFRFTWNDPSGLSSRFCLETWRIRVTQSSMLNKTCVDSAAGTILSPITPVNGSLYEARAYYIKGGTKYLAKYSKSFSDTPPLGNTGLLFQVLLTLGALLLALWSPPVAAIATPMSLVFGRAIGLTSIRYEFIIPVVVVGIIIAYITSNKS